MTLPPVGLGAHDDADLLRGSQGERVQRREKWSCLRMIGITPEERIAPTSIAGALRGNRIAQSPQVLEMPICDPLVRHMAGKPIAVELWIAPREWNSSHIHELRHVRTSEQIEKLLRGVARMPDRIETRAHGRSARKLAAVRILSVSPPSHETMSSRKTTSAPAAGAGAQSATSPLRGARCQRAGAIANLPSLTASITTLSAWAPK
jgi:hypothetical protein